MSKMDIWIAFSSEQAPNKQRERQNSDPTNWN